MSMYVLLQVLQTFGISVAIGSSTFALIFYYKSIRDGVIDASEKSFLHTVYAVLRIGMGLIIISQLLFVVWYYQFSSLEALVNGAFWAMWTILAVIIVNATLMQLHIMPMIIGPAIAGGSWYTLAIVNTLKAYELPYLSWIGYYVLFVGVFAVFLRLVKMLYVDRYQQALKRATLDS